MNEKLVLQEDDQLRHARFEERLSALKIVIRTTFIATPILLACMYLLMRNLPGETFPFPPYFWLYALLGIMLGLPLAFCPILLFGLFHRKCILSKRGVRLSPLESEMITWRNLSEWRIEDSQTYPHHFTVEFRGRRSRRSIEITLPNFYSRNEIRDYIMRSIAQAF